MSCQKAVSGLLAVATASWLVLQATGEEEQGSSRVFEPSLPSADELLSRVMASLPPTPVGISAEIQSRDRDGKLERLMRLEAMLRAGEEDYRAEYTVLDAFGADAEKLVVLGESGRESPFQYSYFQGDPPIAEDVPDLTHSIRGTDLSWADLSLSFLRWPSAKTVGAEKVKGRFCYIVAMSAPASESPAYAAVHVWIDPQLSVFLRVDGFDAAGSRIRRLEVKSFKKLGELWMIKNIDVKSYPSRHQTRVRVRSVTEL